MTSAETNEIASLVQRVQAWPVPLRIALAWRILETVEDVGTAPARLLRWGSARPAQAGATGAG